jgi:ABC-type Fe3+-hydroxamate transport system substrate-binding protein
MPTYTDQLGNRVDIIKFPQRIVSLVPSQTELLFHLGLEDRVAGITKFCVHPASWYRSKKRIGGTKTIKMEVMAGIGPDLIIANKEENIKDQVEELAKHYPVWTSDVHNLETALDMMRSVGAITSTEEQAATIISRISADFAALKNPIFAKAPAGGANLKTAYFIWRDPYMTAGGDTFIHDMLSRCGLENIFGDMTRYPQVTVEMLRNKNCGLLFLSSEPYPFKQKHIDELQEQLPGTKIMLVDGEMFSWYGSRLLEAPAYFRLLFPQIV